MMARRPDKFVGMRLPWMYFHPYAIIERMIDASTDWAERAALDVQIRAQAKIGPVDPLLILRASGVRSFHSRLSKPRPALQPPRSRTGRLLRSIVGRLVVHAQMRSTNFTPVHAGEDRGVLGVSEGTIMRAYSRRLIPGGFDVRSVVGPAASIVGPAGGEHEKGQSRTGATIARRPFMGPAIKEVGPSTMRYWRNSITA